jgi:hypothetical protein
VRRDACACTIFYVGLTSLAGRAILRTGMRKREKERRGDFDCGSRLRGFYGLLTVPALAARVILICIAPLHYPHKDPGVRRQSNLRDARSPLRYGEYGLLPVLCRHSPSRLSCWRLRTLSEISYMSIIDVICASVERAELPSKNFDASTRRLSLSLSLSCIFKKNLFYFSIIFLFIMTVMTAMTCVSPSLSYLLARPLFSLAFPVILLLVNAR